MSGITSLSQDYEAYERHARESVADCPECRGLGRVESPARLSKDLWMHCERCDGTGQEPIMTREEWDYARADEKGEI